MRRFRQGYVASFGAGTRGDTLYEAVSEGRRHPGIEHWLPLFYDRLDTLFDYTGAAPMILDPLAEEAARSGWRRSATITMRAKAPMSPILRMPPISRCRPRPLYLSAAQWGERLAASGLVQVTPFAQPEGKGLVIDCGGKIGRNFAPERNDEGANVFHAAAEHVHALQAQGKRVIVAGWSEGSRERLGHVLKDFGLDRIEPVASLAQAIRQPKSTVALAVIGLEAGFEAADLAVVGEQDILGDRLVHGRRRTRRAQDFYHRGSARFRRAISSSMSIMASAGSMA